jgi:hypothetical protein
LVIEVRSTARASPAKAVRRCCWDKARLRVNIPAPTSLLWGAARCRNELPTLNCSNVMICLLLLNHAGQITLVVSKGLRTTFVQESLTADLRRNVRASQAKAVRRCWHKARRRGSSDVPMQYCMTVIYLFL